MNTIVLNLRRLVLTAFLSLGFVTALQASELGEHAGTVTAPEGLSQDDVKDAVVAALSGRRWGVRSTTDDRVTAYLRHRGNEATVTLIYDATKVDLYCVGWKIDKKTGERQKPEQPKGWLKNIQADIMKHFNRILTQG